ncbi:ras-related protein Rab-40C-like [Oppia nitens]|uniref:ras-related protein Rab-40C-like n=1 Tax=Oppia nitens TaxID=1686743 RepID=UPI0023DAFFE8|nr:ras-related protein Rab-40C-like [Oppia nitens]
MDNSFGSTTSSSSTATTDALLMSLMSAAKSYDYVLKFLLVGDSDVGKDEILNNLDEDNSPLSSTSEPSFGRNPGVGYKTTNILLDGRRIRLQVWDTSGQGRFETIFRSYSRGAQGVILVYDITNRWSFSGLNRWLNQIEEHIPGVPKILVGNRLHLAFKRQVSEYTAQTYANKHNMTFFEISPLCNYNIRETCAQLSRMALQRNGMENIMKMNTVPSLQELCCRAIVTRTTTYSIERLPLPKSLKSCLVSFSSVDNRIWIPSRHQYMSPKEKKTIAKKAKAFFSCDNLTKALSTTSIAYNTTASIAHPSTSTNNRSFSGRPAAAHHHRSDHHRNNNSNKHCTIS